MMTIVNGFNQLAHYKIDSLKFTMKEGRSVASKVPLVLEFFSRFLNHNRHSETKKGFYFGKPSRSHLIGIRVLSQLSNKYINCMTKVSVDHEFFLIECRKYTLIYHRTKRTEARVSHLNRTHRFHNSDETLDQNEYQDLQPRARLGNDIEDKSLNLRVKCARHFVSLSFNRELAKAHNESNLRNTRLNRTKYPALKNASNFHKVKMYILNKEFVY